MTLIVACGLKREARIFERAGVVAVIGGGDATRLEAELEAATERFPGIVLSCGIAGALSPVLMPGDVVVDGDPAIVGRLRRVLPSAHHGAVVGQEAVAATAIHKADLYRRSQAIAVDMESHIAGRVARRRGQPFAVLRVISDRAMDDLPPAALVGMRPDGGMALGAVLSSLARDPRQLPALVRTGRQAAEAFASLRRAFSEAARALI
ncbi:phosphorylase [Sphingomonas sp. TX0543]|uniref:phosphorylase family protein n=1 Tax=unclassified Sphingomonas TaxID=196159 RepID=UPI0010F6D3B7|nr:phosphorylase [Sphingomonas sp. 3P27F8]